MKSLCFLLDPLNPRSYVDGRVFHPMCEVKGEGCCEAEKQSRMVMGFGVTKTVTILPFINCMTWGNDLTSQNLLPSG